MRSSCVERVFARENAGHSRPQPPPNTWTRLPQTCPVATSPRSGQTRRGCGHRDRNADVEGWLFLAVLIDLHSRRVVGGSTSTNNDTPFALAALEMTRSARRSGLTCSSRASPGLSRQPLHQKAYQNPLTAVGSKMSRKENCWDNAVAESFFSKQKTELRINTLLASLCFWPPNAMVKDYTDAFYNTVRLHSTNDFMSPIYFELTSHCTSFAA